jgi:hypothetical protein
MLEVVLLLETQALQETLVRQVMLELQVMQVQLVTLVLQEIQETLQLFLKVQA